MGESQISLTKTVSELCPQYEEEKQSDDDLYISKSVPENNIQESMWLSHLPRDQQTRLSFLVEDEKGLCLHSKLYQHNSGGTVIGLTANIHHPVERSIRNELRLESAREFLTQNEEYTVQDTTTGGVSRYSEGGPTRDHIFNKIQPTSQEHLNEIALNVYHASSFSYTDFLSQP